jgi:hypothetical protein
VDRDSRASDGLGLFFWSVTPADERFGEGCLSVGPSSFAGVTSDLHWSSSSNETGPDLAWYVDLGDGYPLSYPKGFVTLRVWPVRRGPR